MSEEWIVDGRVVGTTAPEGQASNAIHPTIWDGVCLVYAVDFTIDPETGKRLFAGFGEKSKANARLIAAAPELLAACEKSLAVYDAMTGIFGDSAFAPMFPGLPRTEGAPGSLRNLLLAALAKARGTP